MGGLIIFGEIADAPAASRILYTEEDRSFIYAFDEDFPWRGFLLFSMLASSADFILGTTHFWCGFYYFDIVHDFASTCTFFITWDPEIHAINTRRGILSTGFYFSLLLAQK